MNEQLRSELNLSTGTLDALRRIAEARRQLEEIAELLFFARTSTKQQRQDCARRLNSVRASLRTVELTLVPDE